MNGYFVQETDENPQCTAFPILAMEAVQDALTYFLTASILTREGYLHLLNRLENQDAFLLGAFEAFSVEKDLDEVI